MHYTHTRWHLFSSKRERETAQYKLLSHDFTMTTMMTIDSPLFTENFSFGNKEKKETNNLLVCVCVVSFLNQFLNLAFIFPSTWENYFFFLFVLFQNSNGHLKNRGWRTYASFDNTVSVTLHFFFRFPTVKLLFFFLCVLASLRRIMTQLNVNLVHLPT